MSDRELLELAAVAAGIQGEWKERISLYGDYTQSGIDTGRQYFFWNPQQYDNDAFRLAVELGMAVYTGENWARAQIPNEPVFEEFAHEDFQDIFAATRKVITRAAAEIGRQMQEGGAA